MKKQKVLMVFAIIVTLLFAACSSDAYAPPLEELSHAPPLQTAPELEGLVYMVATDVTATHVTVTIQNNSDLTLFTGVSYSLEKYCNGQWLCVPPVEPIAFILALMDIQPHASISFNKDLSRSWPLLETGRYRIRKDVGRHEVVAEFDWDCSLAPPLEGLSPAPPLHICIELDGLVHMVVTDVTSTHATVLMQNNSAWDILSCRLYTLEAYYNGQWLQVPTKIDTARPSVGVGIMPPSSHSFNVQLEHFVHLGIERYRVRKVTGISAVQHYEMVDEIDVDSLPYDFPHDCLTNSPFYPLIPLRAATIHEIVAEFDWYCYSALQLEELSLAPPLQIHPKLDGLVYMVATDVTSTHATVAIQNNSDLQRFTWQDYTLEAYYNGQWRHVPMVESNFTTELIPLPPYDSTSFIKDLSSFPLLGAELYRIRKSVGHHDVVAEFDWGR